jgi:hypothetical protein
MSRSNPTDNSPNPCTRWFEWDGSEGEIRYFDREAKKNVSVGDDFAFLLLDETATIKGWHDPSDSGIYSNEVRDTTAEPFIVKAFKGGELTKGFYREIRDSVIAQGGHFTANLYIAFKDGDLKIGSLQLKGAALNAWVEFRKQGRNEIYKKAVRIHGSNSGKKGKIVFKTPIFSLVATTDETDNQAKDLDGEVQVYLKSYFSRRRNEQAQPQSPDHSEPAGQPDPEPEERPAGVPDEDYVPF